MTKLWADQPFQLMKVPGEPGAVTSTNDGVLYVAKDMANVHNALLRGLNAIYLQCEHITEPQDITDFTLFVKAWGDTITHHHHAEEELAFPGFDKLAKDAGETESIMNANVEQHHLFEPKLKETIEYIEEIRGGKCQYNGTKLKTLIDGFAPVLTQHLHDEIQTLLSLERFDGQAIKDLFDLVVKDAASSADPNLVLPLMFGSIDKTNAPEKNFPAVPFFVPWMNALWFSRRHKGSWRFCACDQWGQPRPLQFLGEA